MNNIHHRSIVIDFDVWEPQYKIVEGEIDTLINALKTKKLLAHGGNTKLQVLDGGRL